MEVFYIDIDYKKYTNCHKARFIWESGTTEVVLNSKKYSLRYLTKDGKRYVLFDPETGRPTSLNLPKENFEVEFTVEEREKDGFSTKGWALNKIIIK